MTRKIQILILMTLLSGASFAHQDMILKISRNGTLEGIPPEFGPAKLLVKFFPKDKWNGHIDTVTLQLGKSTVDLPRCIVELFNTQKMDEITASGSWYHQEKVLPYYLNINFHDAGYDKSKPGNRGYSIIFNLRTGKIVRMNINTINDNGYTMSIPVNISQTCGPIDIKPILDKSY